MPAGTWHRVEAVVDALHAHSLSICLSYPLQRQGELQRKAGEPIRQFIVYRTRFFPPSNFFCPFPNPNWALGWRVRVHEETATVNERLSQLSVAANHLRCQQHMDSRVLCAQPSL